MMLLAIGLLLIGWWFQRRARALEQALAHGVPALRPAWVEITFANPAEAARARDLVMAAFDVHRVVHHRNGGEPGQGRAGAREGRNFFTCVGGLAWYR